MRESVQLSSSGKLLAFHRSVENLYALPAYLILVCLVSRLLVLRPGVHVHAHRIRNLRH